ncbi:MAG TPA: MFS transporter, partial [Solirubrobacteraceae bacterium]|nr:MFS transporter [Solirubrobacteraceae bacterium]
MGSPGFVGVLRHRDFRHLWLAQSASVLGDRIVTIALALFVIDLTGSASDLGFVLAAGALPLTGFLLIGGVWADRLPRHRVMIVSDLARFALHGLLAGLILAGTVRVWEIVLVEALFGTAEAFFRPAAAGLLPQTVPESEIQEAKAMTGLFDNTAEFLGPALGTALVLGIGAGPAFALDAASFLLSAALLTRIRPRARTLAADGGSRGTLRVELREGFREVRSRTWVWATLAAFCVALFAGLAPWLVLGPVVARERYGSVAVFGVVASALGAGTVIGSLVGGRWRPRHPMRMAMLSVLLWPASAILYAAGLTLVAVLPVTVLAGIGLALFDVWWETALAERIPPRLLSRVSSYDWMVSLGLLPLGFLATGPLAAALGPVEVLLGGSVLALLAYLAGLLPRSTRMLERRG